MPNSSIRKFLYSYAWDTRCRNVDVARILKPRITTKTTVLDAGCGEYGVAAFIDAKNVVGVDILPTDTRVEGFEFVHGSILSLPIDERQFDIAVSVDVLEHLPVELRENAVNQLVRAAKKAVVIAFPSGPIAREMDEKYARELDARKEPRPDWLVEHLSSEYPAAVDIAAMIEREARQTGRRVAIKTSYSENISVVGFLRRASSLSKFLYVPANLATGILLPAMPKANETNAYRAIILADFSND